MSTDREYDGEMRKRAFIQSFHKYKKLVGKKLNKLNLKGRKQIINLNKSLVGGVNSLSKRVRNGEIFITSTDKSSRFAILNRKQYLETGHSHTCKDKETNWAEIMYLQSQVNSHMWWLLNIVG